MKTFKPIKLDIENAEVSVPYTTYNVLNKGIRYKIFNNQVEIDLKTIIDSVLNDAGITGFDTKQCLLTIPYDIEDTASGDTLTLLINKKRFHIRLPEMEIVSNKQQKIDWDNTHPHRWSISQWGKYIESRFWNHYGFKSIEMDLRGKQGAIRRGKIFGRIKGMMNTILGLGFSHEDIVQYINWVFLAKSEKVAISLAFLSSDSVIQDWIVWKKKKERQKTDELSSKWK